MAARRTKTKRRTMEPRTRRFEVRLSESLRLWKTDEDPTMAVLSHMVRRSLSEGPSHLSRVQGSRGAHTRVRYRRSVAVEDVAVNALINDTGYKPWLRVARPCAGHIASDVKRMESAK